MLSRLSIASKAMISAALASIGLVALQTASLAALLGTGGHPWTFWASIGLALAWTYAIAVGYTGWWTGRVTRRRTERLVRALQRITAGELRGDLEPSIDTDLVMVREALERMREALDTMTTRLRHVDAQRRRLFGDLSHELATPIGTILAISEALSRDTIVEDRAERTKLLAFLEQEVTRLERLASDMRDLAWLDDPDFSLERGPADVASLARTTVSRLAAVGSGAAIECVGSDARADVDAGRIEQVVTNLVNNARRHAGAEGHVRVEVSATDERVAIVVDDDGAGVPDELLPRLGERLYRPDPARAASTGGHGLGLSIVRAVVQRHGGEIRFERAPMGGLRVAIALPITVAAA